MATDDLVDGDGEDTKTAPAPVGVSASDISKAVKEGLADFGGNLSDYSNRMGQYVQQALQTTQQAQRATNAGNATNEQTDLTQQLLNDPQTAIVGVVQRMLADQLGPYLSTKIQDDYENLIERHRSRIDDEYGDGSFDELIMPELEAVVDKTPNKSSKASKQYIATVVRGIVGHENVLPKLMDKRGAKVEAEKKAEQDAPTGMLDGGRRKGSKPNLSSEDIAHLAHYEEVTDKKVDRKLMEEALTVRRRDGGWTVDNFPKLKKSA
jgi:hypothetical protein